MLGLAGPRLDFDRERSVCRVVTQDPSMDAIATLQHELAILMEELETVVVGPLPMGARRRAAVGRLAAIGQDISTLSAACEVLARRSGNARKATGLAPPTKRY